MPGHRRHDHDQQRGDDVIIAGSVSDDEARETFGEWRSPKPYIRIVPEPQEA